jgi:hypothetical protein
LPFHAGITTSSGHIHAGSMVSLADTSAIRRAVELVDMPVAVSISTQTVGNVQEGTLRSESTVAHPGRTLVVVTTRVTADGGKLLALVNSSHFVQQTDQGNMVAITDKTTGLDPNMWEAVQTRDSRVDGRFVYGVSSTGIYCRPTCPSRRPAPHRVAFFDRAIEAEAAGFRACKRCLPDQETPSTSLVRKVCKYIQEQSDESGSMPTLAELGQAVGAAPRICSGCSKRLPESRRASMRRPGVWTGSRQ